jgi:hypothetical protein
MNNVQNCDSCIVVLDIRKYRNITFFSFKQTTHSFSYTSENKVNSNYFSSDVSKYVLILRK